jgi:hypothetical protein
MLLLHPWVPMSDLKRIFWRVEGARCGGERALLALFRHRRPEWDCVDENNRGMALGPGVLFRQRLAIHWHAVVVFLMCFFYLVGSTRDS